MSGSRSYREINQPVLPELVARRPSSVTAAVVLALTGAFLVALLGALAVVGADDKNLLDGYESSLGGPLDRDLVTSRLRVLGAVMVGWGALVIGVALFAGRRQRWARLTLTVLGVVACAFAPYLTVAFGGVGAPAMFVWVVLWAVLLWTGPARQWYA